MTASPTELYAEALGECTRYMYLDHVDELSDEASRRTFYGVLNAGGWYDPNVQADHAVALQMTKSTAFDIRTRSQAVDPAYVKMAWPYKSRGNESFLMTLKRDGKPMHRLFMLAASEEIKSELDSEVT